MMTKEAVLEKINLFMDTHGEDPFEYQSDAAPEPEVFVKWCIEKGYTTEERFNAFVATNEDWEFFHLFGDLESAAEDEKSGDGEVYSLICSVENGYDYLAEFIASSEEYSNRFESNFEI